MISIVATVERSSHDEDEDPGWCPKRKGDLLCARDFNHYGKCDFSRPVPVERHTPCSFSETRTTAIRLGARKQTQMWTFTCILDEGHRPKHKFSAIPDGHSAAVDVPRSHWKRQRAERRRLMN